MRKDENTFAQGTATNESPVLEAPVSSILSAKRWRCEPLVARHRKGQGLHEAEALDPEEPAISVEDPILVLGFLAHFMAEADILDMRRGNALRGTALLPQGDRQRSIKLVSWNFLDLRVRCNLLAGSSSIRNEVIYNRKSNVICQLSSPKYVAAARQSETTYETRLSMASHKCGNVYSAEEGSTIFVDALDPAISTLVALSQEERRKITYT